MLIDRKNSPHVIASSSQTLVNPLRLAKFYFLAFISKPYLLYTWNCWYFLVYFSVSWKKI